MDHFPRRHRFGSWSKVSKAFESTPARRRAVVRTPHPTRTADPEAPWRDATLPVSERVDLLLEQMTLEEKVAQLGSRWVRNDMQETAAEVDRAPVADHGATLNVA